MHDSFAVECRLDEADYQLQDEQGSGGENDTGSSDGDYVSANAYNTRSKIPKPQKCSQNTNKINISSVQEDTPVASEPAPPPSKKPRSVSTDAKPKKRRKKKGGEPDSEAESSGPDEYDLNDSFIDKRTVSEIERGFLLVSPSLQYLDRKRGHRHRRAASGEEIDDTIKEGEEFLKRV